MSEPVTFGDVRLMPSRRTVSCRGSVTVQPLVMDVLLMLATSGDVVSRAALESQVWKGDHVGYHALPRAISQARRALADVHSTVRIQAVSKLGYRLDAGPVPVPAERAGWRLRQTIPLTHWAALVLAVGLLMHALGRHAAPGHFAVLAALACAFAVSGAVSRGSHAAPRASVSSD